MNFLSVQRKRLISTSMPFSRASDEPFSSTLLSQDQPLRGYQRRARFSAIHETKEIRDPRVGRFCGRLDVRYCLFSIYTGLSNTNQRTQPSAHGRHLRFR